MSAHVIPGTIIGTRMIADRIDANPAIVDARLTKTGKVASVVSGQAGPAAGLAPGSLNSLA